MHPFLLDNKFKNNNIHLWKFFLSMLKIAENSSPELMEFYMKVARENIDYYEGLLNKALDKYNNSTSTA